MIYLYQVFIKRLPMMIVASVILLFDNWGQKRGQAIGGSLRASKLANKLFSCWSLVVSLAFKPWSQRETLLNQVLFFQAICSAHKKNKWYRDTSQRICSLCIHFGSRMHCIYVYECVYRCVYMCVCVCIYTYTYIHIHTCIYILNYSTSL